MLTQAHQYNLASFVGEKAEYYLPRWTAMQATNDKTSWNWSAFFFASYWLVYRKMYTPALVVFLIRRLLKYTLFVSTMRRPVVSGVILLTSLALGMLGNYIYFLYAERAIKTAAATHGSDVPERIAPAVAEAGGTSWFWVFMLFVFGNALERFVVTLLGLSSWTIDMDVDTVFDIL